MIANFANYSYALAGAAYLLFAVLLGTSWQGRLHGAMLTAAAGVSALWGFLLAVEIADPALRNVTAFFAETLRNGAWLVFLALLFAGSSGTGNGHRVLVAGGPALTGVVLLAGLGAFAAGLAGLASPGVDAVLVPGSLALSLFGLIMVEQIYRNAPGRERHGLKYIGLGLAALFAYDLVLYSHALLFGHTNELFWSVRGIVATLCVPLIAASAQRNPNWSVGIFVSRNVVFYTATLVGAGIYLVLMLAAGYYIRVVGGGWGAAAQLVFFVAAILTLALMLFSEDLRARLRVFLSKHFFRNRYDYRDEWLRLMSTLDATEDQGLPLSKRAIKALADILGVRHGLLFLRPQEDGPFGCVAGWNAGMTDARIAPDASLVHFLQRRRWVVEAAEYRWHPERYAGLHADLRELGLEEPGFVVPLFTDEGLMGFVLLGRPAVARSLNFEDHDLLKTAGRQIASYLDQDQKKWELAESRQFETFNRLTAYLMHDLKNLVAQQSLVVENSQKHKNNPQFVDDAIATVKSGVTRMRRVLEQLAQGAPVQNTRNVDLRKLLLEAVAQCADRRPEPRLEAGEARFPVRADRERLLMAIVHAIRNAQDATPADGRVTVRLEGARANCVIHITDTGRGMDRDFIEHRLFRPFDSTKGSQGMGIGAHQVRETVRALGGSLEVESRPGAGTRLRLVLPVAQAAAAPAWSGDPSSPTDRLS